MNSEIEKVLSKTFSNHFNLTGLDWSNLSPVVKLVKHKKNSVIRQADKIETNLYYILEGSTASILFKKDKLVCIDLCFKDEFSGDYQSLLTQQRSGLEIRAITDSVILSIPFDGLFKIYSQKPKIEMERIGRISAERLYILKNKEVIDLKTRSAKERYLTLLNQQPELLQKISLKYLAAYLGISAESLSRIRKELVAK
ncbi:MAG: Crp/Fnr family transcriptional regulator [Bacteroidota bacterium]